ncbi:MAG: hypothetical protein ACOC93_02170 [Planctomycetota bacterium]
MKHKTHAGPTPVGRSETAWEQLLQAVARELDDEPGNLDPVLLDRADMWVVCRDERCAAALPRGTRAGDLPHVKAVTCVYNYLENHREEIPL